MSTELAIQNDLGMSLAEAIGVSNTGGDTKSVSLPRVNLTHNGIMGSIEVNGKTVKTEVVPSGAYKITRGDDNVVYSVNPSIRIFAIRQQWSKWDSSEDKMMKTVMSTDLKGDLKDNMGGINLGRPSGYIEDWASVPEKTKDLIRSIKRKKIVFGMLTANDCIDEAGNPGVLRAGTLTASAGQGGADLVFIPSGADFDIYWYSSGGFGGAGAGWKVVDADTGNSNDADSTAVSLDSASGIVIQNRGALPQGVSIGAPAFYADL